MHVISRSRLVQIVSYDAFTGDFIWKYRSESSFTDCKRPHQACAIWNSQRAGNVASHTNKRGRKELTIDNTRYYAHRLAYFLVHGFMPDEVDHINCDPSDNRISNLRSARRRSNACNCKLQKNNKSGFKGVSWHKRRKKWIAQIYNYSRPTEIGFFETAEEAARAYDAAAVEHHKGYARTNEMLGLYDRAQQLRGGGE